MTKKQAKKFLIVVYALAIIGSITVVDNGIRLGKKMVDVVRNHHWTLVVVK